VKRTETSLSRRPKANKVGRHSANALTHVYVKRRISIRAPHHGSANRRVHHCQTLTNGSPQGGGQVSVHLPWRGGINCFRRLIMPVKWTRALDFVPKMPTNIQIRRSLTPYFQWKTAQCSVFGPNAMRLSSMAETISTETGRRPNPKNHLDAVHARQPGPSATGGAIGGYPGNVIWPALLHRLRLCRSTVWGISVTVASTTASAPRNSNKPDSRRSGLFV
jgi:hypothetical protein